ncbi:hypothetical protein CDEST_11157 [Colletotrichum destructivum]|uniref:Uncharacterized protein n=1 Tax=Colletotrichum destructivum TaxID=34406 RepID=A0AAX4ISF6_9PEZI|nr:hypothetical protein CDEST_11157 [Colletotrichum destructivum]
MSGRCLLKVRRSELTEQGTSLRRGLPLIPGSPDWCRFDNVTSKAPVAYSNLDTGMTRQKCLRENESARLTWVAGCDSRERLENACFKVAWSGLELCEPKGAGIPALVYQIDHGGENFGRECE